MSSDEEVQQQKHKEHKINQKLKKKRKKEKEQAKLKKLQKKAYDLIRDDKRSEFFAQRDKKSSKDKDKHGIKVKKFQKCLKKFLKCYEDDLNDFYDIFSQLDLGAEIETSGIENATVKKRLEKLFKILRVKNIGDENEPKFKKTHKDFQLADYMKRKVENFLDSKSQSSDSQSDGELHESENQDESQSEKEKTQDKRISLEAPSQNNNNQVKKKESNTVSNPSKNEFRILRDEPEYKRKEVEAIMKGHKQNDETIKQYEDEDMNNFLDDVFGKTEKGNLAKFLDSRVKELPKKVEQGQKTEVQYLGGQLSQKITQGSILDYMKQWESERGKSLLELHQEKRKQEKMQRMSMGQMPVRKEFDRENDFVINRVDSRNVLQELKRGGGSLNSKFSRGNVESSFM